MDVAAPADGTAPDKGAEEGVANGMDVDTATAPAAVNSEEVKTDAAAAKPAANAKKPAAAAPATVGYSPILDSEVTTVGICNKAHKASQNLI